MSVGAFFLELKEYSLLAAGRLETGRRISSRFGLDQTISRTDKRVYKFQEVSSLLVLGLLAAEYSGRTFFYVQFRKHMKSRIQAAARRAVGGEE